MSGAGFVRDPLLTRATDLFGVRLPIVQTGMGWVSGASLTAATSEAGGLGILASATMTLDELRAAIDKVASRTSKRCAPSRETRKSSPFTSTRSCCQTPDRTGAFLPYARRPASTGARSERLPPSTL